MTRQNCPGYLALAVLMPWQGLSWWLFAMAFADRNIAENYAALGYLLVGLPASVGTSVGGAVLGFIGPRSGQGWEAIGLLGWAGAAVGLIQVVLFLALVLPA